MPHPRHPNAVLVHPPQVPHRKRAELRIDRRLIIPRRALQSSFSVEIGLLLFVREPDAVVVIVPDFDDGVNVPLPCGAGPLRQREPGGVVGRGDGLVGRACVAPD